MNCKFCNAELPEDVTLCPQCGKENREEIAEETAEAVETAEQTPEEPVEEISEQTVEEITEETAEPQEASAQEEMPKPKSKTWVIVLAVIGAVALFAVLVGAVLFGTGALGKDTAGAKSYTVSEAEAVKAREVVVATVGDEELTNSELQVYFWQSVNEFYNYYGYYMDLSTIGLDLNQPLDQQYYDEAAGTTWQQYFLDSALSTWSRYAALTMAGKEAGYALNADAQAYLDSIPADLESMAVSYGYASAEELLNSDMSPACDMKGYMKFMNTNLYAGQYMESMEEALIPTMDEIEAYYAANAETLIEQGIEQDGSVTVDVRHILICPENPIEDEEGNVTYSEDSWEACRVKAQALYDQWLADGTEDGFTALVAENTEDPGSMSNGGLYTDVYEGEMVPEFNDWCFDTSRKYGDSGLVKTTYGYHLMFFVDSEEIWISGVTNTIVSERSLKIVDDAVTKWPMEANYKKIVLAEPAPETAE